MKARIIGNEIAFKTFNFLKVNDIEISIPNIVQKEFKLKGNNEYVKIDEFDKIKYGISKEALDLNIKYLNYYNSYIAGKDDKKDFGLYLFELDDDYDTLSDMHDIVAEKNSKIRLVLDYTSSGDLNKFRNSVIRILAKEKSVVDLFVIQRDSLDTLALESIGIYACEGAIVNVYQYEVGAGKLYTNYKCELIGDSSQGNLNSIYFGQKDEYLNMNYDMVHSGKKTMSNIMVNGALKDKSIKNFKSNLQFIEGASGAVGSEEEYTILLDDSVHSTSVPLMLAHEDDVVGNHASSAGKLDKNQLFYLMTRGISLEEAEALIVESKFSSAIDMINDDKLEDEVWHSVRKIIKEGGLNV